MAAVTQRQYGTDSGRGGGRCGRRSSFIVLTIICITVRMDAVTIVRRMAKHKCVLQNTYVFFKTHLVFCKTHLCFQSMGPVCGIHFRKDANYLKNEISFSNIGDFKKIWKRAKTFFLVRIPVSSCVILVPLRL